MIYTAKNTRFNRKTNLVEKTIQLIIKKNGLVYFVILSEESSPVFCSCEEGLFEKEFSIATQDEINLSQKILNTESLDISAISFKRYPTEVG